MRDVRRTISMQTISSYIFALLPGLALGIMISICHLKRTGGEEKDRNVVYPCILLFGSIPTLLFLYQIKNLIHGLYHAPDVALAFGLFTGMVGTYVTMIHRSPKNQKYKGEK